ncbi:hypothetical protein FRC03_012163 [Tulasnella sp. 419]|nr:hypothetical protein FRC03_012163 [Tulasnella sp. 419]
MRMVIVCIDQDTKNTSEVEVEVDSRHLVLSSVPYFYKSHSTSQWWLNANCSVSNLYGLGGELRTELSPSRSGIKGPKCYAATSLKPVRVLGALLWLKRRYTSTAQNFNMASCHVSIVG